MFFTMQTLSSFNTSSSVLLVFQEIIEPLMCDISESFKISTVKTLMKIFWGFHKQLIYIGQFSAL